MAVSNISLKLLSLFAVVGLSACSSVSYLDNKTLKTQYSDHPIISSSNLPKTYGAFLINSPSDIKEEDRSDPGAVIGLAKTDKNGNADTLVIIRREKYRFMAETLLDDYTGDKDAIFSKSYLLMAADRKQKALGVWLRFEF
jgi:hypothetical protein